MLLHGRRSNVLTVGTPLALILLALASDLSAQQAPPVPIARRWILAAMQHEPGKVDDALLDVAGWSNDQFENVRRSLKDAIAKTIDDRGRRVDVIRRGVMLHTDIATLTPDRAATFDRIGESAPRGSAWLRGQWLPPPGSDSVVVGVDGQFVGLEEVTAHWPFARLLIRQIPDAGLDPFVVRWYRATTAGFEREYRLGIALPHLREAQDVLPRDPWILFYSGAMHEALAAPRYQNIARSQPQRPGQPRPLDSSRVELGRAREFYSKATEADPAFAEAHLRLGRVLGLLGRHEQALDALKRGLAMTDDPALRYFGELFSAAELEELGLVKEARTAYERCAALAPTAQAPLLGISELARRRGDRDAALAAMQRVAARPGGPDDRVDPWWVYLRSHAWNADKLLEEVRRSLRRGGSQ